MKKLNNGDLVFILNHDSHDKTAAIKGRVKECVSGSGENYNACPEYRVISEKGEEYFLLYPESDAPLFLLTGPEYIEYLNLEKTNINTKIYRLNEKKQLIENRIQEINATLLENNSSNCVENTSFTKIKRN